MKIKILGFVLLCGSVSVFAVDEMPISTELPTMEKPTRGDVGYVWVARHSDGSRYEQELLSIDDNGLNWKDNRGCTWTQPRFFEFEPVTEWANCAGGVEKGRQYIDSAKGAAWPLNDDTEFHYRYRGIGGSYNWRGTRRCKVDGQVRVSVPIGEYDTYKVVCKTQWDERTWWVSPELGDAVAYKRWHENDAERRYTLEVIEIVDQ
ncbi:MAG: hypothetical protein U5R46_02705 [Gammaproteobacteria bacterium]|nr:hypothetical protein [Gammaproteobacteria bacterium]